MSVEPNEQPEAAGRGPGGERRWRPSLLERLRNYLITGIIVSAPIAITFMIVRWVIAFFDDLVRQFLPQAYRPETYLPFWLPGVGLVVTLVALVLIGMFAAGFIGRAVMRAGERLLGTMPLVRNIYGALKQIFEALLAQSSRSFREVVLIEFPSPGIWSIGFVTGESAVTGAVPGLVNVFVPLTPNPTSGFMIMVRRDRLQHLELSVEDAFKLILSGGIVTPPSGQVTAEPPSARREQPRGVMALEDVQQQP